MGIGQAQSLGAVKHEDVIAERELVFVAPDGLEIASRIQFGRPYFRDIHGFCCDFEIPSVEQQRYAAGVDGIQAITLAMCMAASILDAKCENGWRILWPGTRAETSAKEIFFSGAVRENWTGRPRG